VLIAVIAAFGLIESPLVVLLIPVVLVSGLIFAEISMICPALVSGVDSFNPTDDSP